MRKSLQKRWYEFGLEHLQNQKKELENQLEAIESSYC